MIKCLALLSAAAAILYSTREIVEGIEADVINANLDVDVGATGTAAVTTGANCLSLLYNLTGHNINTTQMGIKRFIAITMIDNNKVAIVVITA
jgi:hypothetical protein